MNPLKTRLDIGGQKGHACPALPAGGRQAGIASFALLFITVLTIFVLWEINDSITYFSRLADEQARIANARPRTTQQQPVCLTGEEGNCNDSNDVFILE